MVLVNGIPGDSILYFIYYTFPSPALPGSGSMGIISALNGKGTPLFYSKNETMSEMLRN